ncbi:MAG: tetrathionate reductase family octaheme c-type cytochrome [Anaerolineales bacterium]
MKLSKFGWLFGLVLIVSLIAIPLVIFLPAGEKSSPDDPWENVPLRVPHTDHSDIVQGPFETPQDVTRACLKCHEDAADQVMATVHWTWESQPYQLEGRDSPITVGKKNSINNFCIGIQSNWPGCTSCHAGYGWEDANFDFSQQDNVDCLVCHDSTGTYVKGYAGIPVEGVDLLEVAQSVAQPSRENCGGCHFDGGGGNAVKHGDLDETLYFPPSNVDVHMGENDFLCTDCHQTTDHNIMGRSISVSLDDANQIYCTDCHSEDLHEDQRINAHVDSVACQSCHIPNAATRDATKMYWDWSTAGSDEIEESLHTYLKIKGSFVYEANFTPVYRWYNGGVAERYIFGDVINPDEMVLINLPAGDIKDPSAKIFPFKIHTANQPYDTVNNILLQPKTVGEGGYWEDFDWDQALRLGSEVVGLDYSGEYGFTETEMFWPTTHMVAPAADALTCDQCHGPEGRMDWEALGYYGDPIEWGGRFQSNSYQP